MARLRCLFADMIHPRAVIIGLLILPLAHVGAQEPVVVHYDGNGGHSDSRVSNGVLTIEREDSYWAPSRWSARVADLDLEHVQPHGEGRWWQLTIECEAHCAFSGGARTSTPTFGTNGSSDGTTLVVDCNSERDCTNFLAALRGRTSAALPSPKPPPVQLRQPPALSAAASAPKPVPVPPPVLADNPFHDIFDGITWRNGGSGKSALDQLAANISPDPSHAARPVVHQFTFAAFAQSGGFDANDQWGAATGTNLNGTIGTANTTCAHRAGTTCDDEGYCMLRPGLWGAWASDRKYMGNKAFACNLNTEEEARERARSWCGNGCDVLWWGAGK